MMTDVGEFHEKFGLQNTNYEGAGPTGLELDPTLLKFRRDFLLEELDEFAVSMHNNDLPGMADALVDIVYVALGTAHLLGLPWQTLWDDVQRANMAKERAAADGSNSVRNSPWDVVKPEGWVGPETAQILRDYGFDV